MQQTQQTTAPVQNSFWAGFHDGVPIGLGYLSVSVTFGMMAVTGGPAVWAAVAISMTNVTSAGQFAGLSLIFGGGTLFETALTQFVINLRYALMSLSLSQKLERRVGLTTACCSLYDDGRGVRRGVRAKGRGGQALSVRRDDRALLRLGAGHAVRRRGQRLFAAVGAQRAVHRHLRHVHRHRGARCKAEPRRAGRGGSGCRAQLRHALAACAEHGFQRVFPSSSAPCWRRAWRAGRRRCRTSLPEHRTGRWRK